MFSKGQLIFAICFIALFIVIMTLAYKKDKTLHSKHYKGTLKIVGAFMIFLGLLFFIKYILAK